LEFAQPSDNSREKGSGPPAGGDAVVLKDVNYPGGECDLMFSKENGIGFYSRRIGGGASGVVLSTSRTACKSTGTSFNFQTNAVANTMQTSLNLTFGSGITVKNTSGATVSVSGTGLTTTKTVKGSTGANCTITFTAGVMTATTCPRTQALESKHSLCANDRRL
jgi:hypothetical protein